MTERETGNRKIVTQPSVDSPAHQTRRRPCRTAGTLSQFVLLFFLLISAFSLLIPAPAARADSTCVAPTGGLVGWWKLDDGAGSNGPTSGLIGWWKLDEGSGTSATDSSGSSNTGTLNGSPLPTWTTGKINDALNFNGTNDYVNITNSINPSQITVSAWVNPSNASQPMQDVYANGIDAATLRICDTNNLSGCYPDFVVQNTAGVYHFAYDAHVLSSNTWYFLVGTYDGTNARFYINGIEADHSPVAHSDLKSNAFDSEFIGVHARATGNYFSGTIDDVRVYNRALNAGEVTALYNATSPATTAADSSGNGMTGTLTNGPTWGTGVINGDLAFNGVNQKVSIPYAAPLNLPGDWTVSTWFKLASYPSSGNYYELLDLEGGSNDTVTFFVGDNYCGASGGNADFNINYNNGGGTAACNPNNVATGVWYHGAAVYDSQAQTLTMYLNGAVDKVQSESVAPTVLSSGALNLGYSPHYGTYAPATLDDVRVYNRALSAAEIAQIYAATNPAHAGSMIYNPAYRAYQYCDGQFWKSMGPVGDTTTGLIDWWKFDEGSGTTAADSAGSLTGTVNGTTTWATGMNNGALSFDGATNYVSMGTNHPCGTGACTVSAWLYVNPAISSFAEWIELGYQALACDIYLPNMKYECSNDSFTHAAAAANNTIVYNQWTLVTAVRNASGQVTMYVNGVQSGSANQNAGTVNTGTLNFNIGSDKSGTIYFFNGLIDDVRVYNRALSANDVMTLYTSTGRSKGAGERGISAGYTHSCGIDDSGSAWCWGSDANGELGDNGSTQQDAPVIVQDSAEWQTVSAGGYSNGDHTCGIKTDGSAWCWGKGTYGELGNSSTADQGAPVAVSGGATWTAISAGGEHTCGIKTDGSAWCWGYNGYDQLGDNLSGQKTTPQAVSGGGTWKAISAGYLHSCGIQTDGSAWCWGYDNHGQLGDNGSTNQNVPVAVSGGYTWQSISVGYFYTCGIQTDGSAWCWGYNSYGQQGNGSYAQSGVPVAVSGNTIWKTISTGAYHTCGIKTDDSLWCWGRNDSGQLGNGGSGTKNTPQAIASGTTWKAVSAGGFVNGAYGEQTCGIQMDGTLWCWGYNGNGQVGTGDTSNQSTPFEVSSAAFACANPTGYSGDLIYNAGSYHVPQYCNGTDWIATGTVSPAGGGGGGCANPGGSEGDVMYNADHHYMQYCDGTTWRAMGGLRAAPTNGLAGWWKLDDGTSGTTPTTAADSSGQGNTGTNQNSPTWAAGKIGNALTFSGSNQFVDVPNAASLRLSGSWTVATWVKLSAVPASGNAGTLVAKWSEHNGANNYNLIVDNAVYGAGKGWVILFNSTGCCDNNYTKYTTSISTGVWYYVSAVYDATAQTETLYLNGVQVATNSFPGLPPEAADGTGASSNDLTIGADTNGTSAVNGAIDDARIYNRALSAKEIWDIYVATGGQ